MKYIIVILFLLVGFASFSQVNQFLGAPNTRVTVRGDMWVDSSLRFPKRLLGDSRQKDTGLVYWRISDSSIQAWTGFQWLTFRSGGSFANNGLFKNGDTIKLGGDIFQNVTLNTINASAITFSTLGTTNHQLPANGNAYFALGSADAKVGIGTSSPTTRLDVRGIGLIASPATGYEFTGWPTSYESGFNHNVLGVFGDEPSLDIMVDSNSSFGIGGVTFRILEAGSPFLTASRFGANAFAKIEANTFDDGLGRKISTIEFYLGDTLANRLHRFALSGPGNHFFGFRKLFTVDVNEALFVGTAPNGSSDASFSVLDTTYLAVNADNRPLYILRMPSISPDTTNYKPLVINNTNGKWYKSFWPSTSVSNTNIGAGYRVLLPGTQEIKTLFAGTNITIDSTTNANGLTITAAASSVNLDTSRNATSATIIASGTDAVIPLVSFPANLAGLMSPVDKGRLDSLYGGLLPGDTIRLIRSSDSVYLCITPPGGVQTCTFQYIDSTSGGSGSGDVISNETSNTDGQLPLFGTQTDGKHIKKFTGTGILEATSGVVSAITTSAGIAAQISDETGTGVMVFGTAPTFTTSIINPLMIGGTGTGSTATIRSTSGVGATDAIRFEVGNNGATLAALFNNGGQLIGINGTAALPTYAFTGNTNSGLFRSGTNITGISAAGNAFTFSGQTFQFGTWSNGITNNILGTNAGAGTSNRAANTMRIAAGQGTGNGAASEIQLEVGTTGSSGTSLNALSQIMRITTTGINLNFAPNGAVTDSILTINATAVRKVAASLFAATGSGGYVDYGTYTPTLTNVANVAASVALNCQWMRVGNTVHVSGAFDMDATTTATLTQLGISLPIATTIAEEYHCAGVANATASTVTETGKIIGDVSNSRAEFWINVVSTSNQRYFFTFTYRITPS